MSGDTPTPEDSPSSTGAREQRVDTTRGPLLRKMLLLSWPIVVTHLLQTVVGIADTWMVGSLGAEELAAVGIARTVFFILMAVAFTVSMGVRILVAQYSGSGDMRSVDGIVKQGIIASVLISLAFVTPAGVLGSGWIMKMVGASPEVMDHGVLYLQLLFSGMVFMVLSFVITGALQGVGDTITPLILLVFTNIINIVGNYVCIFGAGPFPAMGVSGAAIGTLVARGVSTVLSLWILGSGRFAITLHWRRSWQVRWDSWSRIFCLGVPASLQGISRSFGFILIIKILSLTTAATYAISGFTVAGQVRMVTAMVGLALMAGATTAVGQNVGAGNLRRASSASWLSAGIAAAISTVAATAYAIFGAHLVRWFNTEPEVVRIGAEALLVLAISEPFLTAGMSLSGSLRGAGDTITPLWVTIATITIIGPLTAYILAIHLGMDTLGVWLGFDLGIIIRLFLLTWKWRQGKWQELKVA